MSLADEDRAVAALGRRTTLLLRRIGVLLLAAAVGLFVRGVRHPTARRDRRGPPNGSPAAISISPIPVPRSDEIGRLAASFNDMTASLRAGARRPPAPEREPRAPGRGADGGAEGRPGAADPVREDVVARQARGLGRARDQQPAGRHPDLRQAADPDARGRRTVGAGRGTRRSGISGSSQRETERCTAIVRNLLDFARQRPPSLKEIDVSAVVDEALSLLAAPPADAERRRS